MKTNGWELPHTNAAAVRNTGNSTDNCGGLSRVVHSHTNRKPQLGDKKTEESKRKALEALDSRGTRHDAATAADVSLKTLDDWRRRDAQFAADWDATIERVMTRLRKQPFDDKGELKRSPLQYGLKATDENKEIVLAMLANGATYAAAAAAVGAHRRTITRAPRKAAMLSSCSTQ